MTSPQFINFIERKLREHGITKVIPDETVLAEMYAGFEKGRRLKDAVRQLDKIDMSGFSAPKDLQRRVRQYLKQHPAVRWDVALSALVAEHARPQSRAKRPRNGNSSPSSEGAS